MQQNNWQKRSYYWNYPCWLSLPCVAPHLFLDALLFIYKESSIAKLYCHSLSPFLFHDIILIKQWKLQRKRYKVPNIFCVHNWQCRTDVWAAVIEHAIHLFEETKVLEFFLSFFSRSIFSFLFSSIIHGIYCICVFALSFPMALGLLPVVASTSTAAAAAASVSRHTWTFYQSPNSATKYRLTNCRKESLWLHLKAFWSSVLETMRLAILESLL